MSLAPKRPNPNAKTGCFGGRREDIIADRVARRQGIKDWEAAKAESDKIPMTVELDNDMIVDACKAWFHSRRESVADEEAAMFNAIEAALKGKYIVKRA